MPVATPIIPSYRSNEALINYYKSIIDNNSASRSNFRTKLERVDRLYQRELNAQEKQAKAKAANRNGDTSKYQDITVPLVATQVETAVTYQASVFLTGDPIFGVVAPPKFANAALQMETILEENSIRGGWANELIKFFRNGYKYNFAPLEVDWTAEKTYDVYTDLQADLKSGKLKEVIWEGNTLKSLDPYNTFVDRSVAPTEVYKYGEYAGYTEYYSRIRLKDFINNLEEPILRNIPLAYKSGLGARSGIATDSSAAGFYVPQINPDINQYNDYVGHNWLSWACLDSNDVDRNLDYQDGYEVTTLYCRILPSDFKLSGPSANTPQIYKLIIVNHEHIIQCERQTNAHKYIPLFIGQPYQDDLKYQTKSLADNAEPFQHVTTAYMSSILASRRRAISDRTLYDPSRITSSAINSANPSAKIPVRPAAYGKNIAESVYHFPYREDQAASSMQQIQMLLGIANNLSGQNQAVQGQFVKGNKTLHEFESVMQNANGRDQLCAIQLEHQCFVPIKHVLKSNILQYQGSTVLYNEDKDVEVEIDPTVLRKAVFKFRVSDGLVPASKILNSDTLSVALQTIGSSPQLAGGYNIAQMFSYLMKMQGAKIQEFEKSQEQLAYENALGTWQGLMQLVIEKGVDPQQLGVDPSKMPKPEDYNYQPADITSKSNIEEEVTQ